MLRTVLGLVVLSPALAQEAPIPHPREVGAAVERGVAVLLDQQEDYVRDRGPGRVSDDELAEWQAAERARLAELRAEGEPGAEWPYQGVYRVGGVIPAGYRVGGTSIACLALLAAPGFAEDEARVAAVERALDFVLTQVEENPALAPGPRKSYDVRGWGHAYALRLILTLIDADAVPDELEARAEAALVFLLRCLEENALEVGGWNYASVDRASPFQTGSTLLTLFHARARGHGFDDQMVERALDALERGRKDNRAYAYAGDARRRVEMPGSSARSSVASLALYLGGRNEVADLRKAVHGFFEGWPDLLDRKSKQGTHEGEYGIAPYYFFFGHTYAAAAIESLPPEERLELRQRLQGVLFATREEDGSWNDRVFPRSSAYGTAMSVLALRAPVWAGFPRWRAEDE